MQTREVWMRILARHEKDVWRTILTSKWMKD